MNRYKDAIIVEQERPNIIGGSFNKLVGAGGKFPGITNEMFDKKLLGWLKNKGIPESDYYRNPEVKAKFEEDLMGELRASAYNRANPPQKR